MSLRSLLPPAVSFTLTATLPSVVHGGTREAQNGEASAEPQGASKQRTGPRTQLLGHWPFHQGVWTPSRAASQGTRGRPGWCSRRERPASDASAFPKFTKNVTVTGGREALSSPSVCPLPGSAPTHLHAGVPPCPRPKFVSPFKSPQMPLDGQLTHNLSSSPRPAALLPDPRAWARPLASTPQRNHAGAEEFHL